MAHNLQFGSLDWNDVPSCKDKTLSQIGKALGTSYLQVFFVVVARHKPVLDGFDQHFEASVHFPLTSTSQQYRNKFSGMRRIKPGAAG